MDKSIYFKVVRRACMVLVVLILLVACSAQVHAEDEGTVDTETLSAMTGAVTEETGLTEENFSAVAVQLEAVARADGRSAADRMLYTAFSSASELNVSETAPVTAAAESSVNVIVVPEKKMELSFTQIVLLFLVLSAAVGAMLAVFTAHRRNMRGTVYKPMRSGSSQANPYANYGMVRTYR